MLSGRCVAQSMFYSMLCCAMACNQPFIPPTCQHHQQPNKHSHTKKGTGLANQQNMKIPTDSCPRPQTVRLQRACVALWVMRWCVNVCVGRTSLSVHGKKCCCCIRLWHILQRRGLDAQSPPSGTATDWADAAQQQPWTPAESVKLGATE